MMSTQPGKCARYRLLWEIVLAGAFLVTTLVGLSGCGMLDDALGTSAAPRTRVEPREAQATTGPVQPVAAATPSPPRPASTPTFVPTRVPAITNAASLPSTGHVIYAGDDGVSLRAAPNGQKLAALLKGSQVRLEGESRHEGGFIWWPVVVAPGWIAEGPGDAIQPRWLLPVEAGATGSGAELRVVYPGRDGLNLRQAPGQEGPLIATLAQDSVVTVTGAARTVNGVVWWPVRLPAGWMAEGSSDAGQPRWLALNMP